MHIMDLYNKKITVTDLDKAIEQADLFKDNYHVDPSYKEADERMQKYWTDIFEKLIKLKNRSP